MGGVEVRKYPCSNSGPEAWGDFECKLSVMVHLVSSRRRTASRHEQIGRFIWEKCGPWFRLLGVWVGILLVGVGCGASSSDSQTALPRDSVDRKTGKTLIQAQQALRQGALQASMALTDSVVHRVPRLPDAHFQRGRVLSELKRFESANQSYRKALDLDPDYRGAWYNLGNNAYRQQDYQEAVNFYQRAQKKHPSANTLVALGWTYVAQGKTDSARYAYERAIDHDSLHALAHARLGQLYANEGNYKKALVHSRRALKLEPKNPKFRYAVGNQLLQFGRPEKAVDHLKTAVEQRPWHQGAHYNLGQALTRLGREEEAEKYLAEADSLEQQQSKIERLRSNAKDAPDEPGRWVTLGKALRQSGRLKQARKAFSVALYLQPRNPALRNEIAKLASDLGEYEAAISHYRTLLRQTPSYVRGWFNLGVVYARRGSTKKAKKAWEKVLEINPDHQKAKEYLASLTSR